jgi:hypothetical protein
MGLGYLYVIVHLCFAKLVVPISLVFIPLRMEAADSLVFNAVVAAGFDFARAADIIADQ